ncbi:Oxygen-dependent choline dehydrogenase [Lachnellula suecica]|uniref:Oxygen-dependent choline dehydrogenase n=1 Tax=Lachnellula suecica TaxID=602035 RepID=A0A8T9BTM4_9HELO|nr:Oxygen-dependent choline dehydrogenase [Lachnellula suecica]
MGTSVVWLFSFFLALLLAPSANGADTASYDYIVVGSGPGGGTLAANLAKAGESVLLLEAGDDQSDNVHEKVPGLFNQAWNDPLMRWDFFVKYHSDEALNRKFEHLTWRTTDGKFYVGQDPPAGAQQLGVYYPRSGSLGGCSTHNAMCAPITSNSDWDEIAALTGDSSWTAKNMRQHYINLENYHNGPNETAGHGYSGFLDITVNTDELLRNQSEATTVLEAEAKLFGQDPSQVHDLIKRDMNSDDADRDKQGHRVSAADIILQTLNATTSTGAKKYPLTLSLHSFATKILFNTKAKNETRPRAIGIEYLEGMSIYSADPRHTNTTTGVKKQAFAKKEVIIAGGAFNSPQLLMLSGIGPKAHLAEFNIPVLVDLPGVGTNLQDNTEYGVAAGASVDFTSKGPSCTYDTPGIDDPCMPPWEENKGPYTQGPLVAAMFKSSASVNGERDIFYFQLTGLTTYQGYWPADTVNSIPLKPANIYDFSMVKINPQGRKGTLRLTSSNPVDMPDINFRFFEEGGDVDLQAMVDAVEFGRKVFDSVPSPLGPFTEIFPCNGTRDCDVKETIRAQTWSHHATSTCAIGADNDTLAVLDSKYRVRGVDGLRVVDASAFPKTPGAFPVIPTFMLGMKASGVILEDPAKW